MSVKGQACWRLNISVHETEKLSLEAIRRFVEASEAPVLEIAAAIPTFPPSRLRLPICLKLKARKEPSPSSPDLRLLQAHPSIGKDFTPAPPSRPDGDRPHGAQAGRALRVAQVNGVGSRRHGPTACARIPVGRGGGRCLLIPLDGPRLRRPRREQSLLPAKKPLGRLVGAGRQSQ